MRLNTTYLIKTKIGIYKIENTINKKVYIGKSENILERWAHHIKELNRGVHKNTHLQSSWEKHGASNFNFVILEICSKKELNKKEILWIKQLQSYKKEFGYNKTMGGTGGLLTDESLEKMRKTHKGKTIPESTRRKISDSLKRSKANVGSKNGMFKKKPWNKGKTKDTDPVLLEMSLFFKEKNKNVVHNRKGSKLSESSKIKISKTHKGIPKSPEHKAKLSQANLGKKLSAETRAKMSSSRKNKPQKKIQCPHCSKYGGTTMYRWHFDFCKSKLK